LCALPPPLLRIQGDPAGLRSRAAAIPDRAFFDHDDDGHLLSLAAQRDEDDAAKFAAGELDEITAARVVEAAE
jgi:hypothetical protein